MIDSLNPLVKLVFSIFVSAIYICWSIRVKFTCLFCESWFLLNPFSDWFSFECKICCCLMNWVLCEVILNFLDYRIIFGTASWISNIKTEKYFGEIYFILVKTLMTKSFWKINDMDAESEDELSTGYLKECGKIKYVFSNISLYTKIHIMLIWYWKFYKVKFIWWSNFAILILCSSVMRPCVFRLHCSILGNSDVICSHKLICINDSKYWSYQTL